ncbi:hypothetical protein PROFUN_03296 [Planoprotostelium fungivorum]|uniref:PH domain-containing protein n=1 Tax=Planoprotostelium fungivorum TaxID=1890364 RepID=A0A2P6NWP1_9EUKA|nr:hypothetical protein PROFUN_03296 [Planoprotostelium fungivorum]
MEEVESMLRSAFRDTETMNRKLDEFETTKSRETLNEVTAMLKVVMQQLKDIRANTDAKREYGQMQTELGVKMKELVARIKAGANLVSSAPVEKQPEATDRSKRVSATLPSNPAASRTSFMGNSRRPAGAANMGNPNRQSLREKETFDHLKVPLKGYMKKQGEDILKQWKKRFFQIAAPKAGESYLLYYSKDESSEKEKGFIDLGTVTKVIDVVGQSIDLDTGSRVYHLQANSREDHKYWLDGLRGWVKAIESEGGAFITGSRTSEIYTTEPSVQEYTSRPRTGSSANEDKVRVEREARMSYEKQAEEERTRKREEEARREEDRKRHEEHQKEQEERMKKQREKELAAEQERERLEKEDKMRNEEAMMNRARREAEEKKQEELLRIKREEEERQRTEEEARQRQLMIEDDKRRREEKERMEEDERRRIAEKVRQDEEKKNAAERAKLESAAKQKKVELEEQEEEQKTPASPTTVKRAPGLERAWKAEGFKPRMLSVGSQRGLNVTASPGSSPVDSFVSGSPPTSTNDREVTELREQVKQLTDKVHELEDTIAKDISKDVFVKLELELRRMEKEYEELRNRYRLDEERFRMAEEKREQEQKTCKELEEENRGKDNHIRRLQKKLKAARKEEPESTSASVGSYSNMTAAANSGAHSSMNGGGAEQGDVQKDRLISKLRETIWAHQQQNSALSVEMSREASAFLMKMRVKDEVIRQQEREMKALRENHSLIREKFVAQQIGLDSPHDDNSKDVELQKIQRAYFFSIAVACKLQYAPESNMNITELLEKAISLNVEWQEYQEWIPKQIIDYSKKHPPQ